LKIELDIPRDLDDVAVDEFSTTGFVNCTLDCADFDFSIGNQRVDAIVAEFKNGVPSMLADGRRVKVEGELIDGLLKANEIEFKDQEARVHAAFAGDVGDIVVDVESPNLGSFKLLGIEIQVIPSTRVIDKREVLVGIDVDLRTLNADDSLEVRGIVNAPGVITAFRVKNRGNRHRDIRLDGPVELPDETTTGQFTILDVPVFTGVNTGTGKKTTFNIDEPMGTSEVVSDLCFFENLNEGDFVEVSGDADFPAIFTDASDTATDVTLVKKKNEPTCSPAP
jgi:hypothetical protein